MSIRKLIVGLMLCLVASAAADTISVSSNFNGTAINPGSTVWFLANINPPSLSGGTATLNLAGGHINFTANSTAYNIAIPNSQIVWSSSVSTATTTFDVSTNTWITTLPISSTGSNAFMAGVALPVPGGLPGGINPVSFTFDSVWASGGAVGQTFQWQWSAAVYTCFSTDYNSLGVKPIEGSTYSSYNNSDHTGTPENYKNCVTGGARGGGGSNFTGSWSSTGNFVGHEAPQTPVPEPATIALVGTGLVFAGRLRRKR